MTANFPGGGPVPPSFATPSRPATASRAGIWLGGIAVVLAAAALVVGIIALTTGASRAASQPSPTEGTASTASEPEVFVAGPDKELCIAIAPLMCEETDRANAFFATGAPDSSQRKAAIPDFKAGTLDWADRAQSVLNEHADPPRYLTRTLQQYIDGMLLYSENIYPEKAPDAYDDETYDSAAVAYGGPLGTCNRMGVRW